jgi:hypothetical protein
MRYFVVAITAKYPSWRDISRLSHSNNNTDDQKCAAISLLMSYFVVVIVVAKYPSWHFYSRWSQSQETNDQ